MNREHIVDQLKTLIAPYVEDKAAIETLSETSELVNHLHVNSLHLIDVVMDVEAAFDIEISADEADGLRTVGSVLDLIERKRSRVVT